MNSEEYNIFVNQVNDKGYRRFIDGYNPNLLIKIYEEERREVEEIIVREFNNNDINMLVFMPKLKSEDGLKLLLKKSEEVKVNSLFYATIMRILYCETTEQTYLDKLINILQSNNENERINAVKELQKCGKSLKLYEIYKECCLSDEDEDVRCESVNGMFYCKNVINDITSFEEKTNLSKEFKTLKLQMFEGNENDRKEAISKFEVLVK